MNSLHMSPEEFRELAERVLEIATAYLRDLPNRSIPAKGGGAEIEQLFHRKLAEQGLPEAALAGLHDTVRYSRAQNGRFFGYVLGSGEPAAAVVDLLCSVLNQNVTAWRSSPAAVTIEHEVIRWLGEAVGCDAFAGILTGGGSSANLMGLAMAREAELAANASDLVTDPGNRHGEPPRQFTTVGEFVLRAWLWIHLQFVALRQDRLRRFGDVGRCLSLKASMSHGTSPD